jgi:outer membrane receptor for ferrienterochelin and colicin
MRTSRWSGPSRRLSSPAVSLFMTLFHGLGVLHPSVATADAAATASGPVLQEVIVTATRRSEDLSQVAQSVAVFDAASLDARGIRTAEDLAGIAPGVDLTQALGIQTNIAIRGISNSAGQQTTGDATTGIYIDDTPVQIRSIGNGPGDPLPYIFDVARVEVLRAVEEIEVRVSEAAKYFPKERMALSPQCGFCSLVGVEGFDASIQEAKLRVVVEAATRIWG